MGSDAVKYIWTMKARTDALLIAGGALGPESEEEFGPRVDHDKSWQNLFGKTFWETKYTSFLNLGATMATDSA